MLTNIACPECRGRLEIVEPPDGAVGVLYFDPAIGGTVERIEDRAFASCTACEFCLDLTQANPELLKGRVA